MARPSWDRVILHDHIKLKAKSLYSFRQAKNKPISYANTLKDIESKFRGREKAGRAKRLALSSEDYLKAIDDIALFREKALKARVEVDTLRMLIQARRSLNSFVKVAREKGIQI